MVIGELVARKGYYLYSVSTTTVKYRPTYERYLSAGPQGPFYGYGGRQLLKLFHYCHFLFRRIGRSDHESYSGIRT